MAVASDALPIRVELHTFLCGSLPLPTQFKVKPAAAHPQVLVADAAVEGLDVLLRGLLPGTRLELVGPGDNPWPLLASLRTIPGLQQLHLLGHGRPGALRLGRVWLNQRWMRRLAPFGWAHPPQAICLWACSTGAGTTGRSFLQTLADGCGARVFAADRPLGAADRGGSWTLNVQAEPRGATGPPRPPTPPRPLTTPLLHRARPAPPDPIP